ncbi:MAG: peptidylprolyl isomerase [Clostridia bacterium]
MNKDKLKELEKAKEKAKERAKAKKKNKKLLKIIMSGIAVLVALAIAAGIWYIGEGNYIGKAGNQVISKVVYTYFLNNIARQMEQISEATDLTKRQSFWQSNIGTQKATDYVKENAIVEATNYVIQLQKAKQTMTLTADEKSKGEEYVASIITQLKSKEAADKKLKEVYGISFDQFKSLYFDQLLVTKYSDLQKKPIEAKITAADIKAYYNKNIDQLRDVTVRHILIPTTAADGTTPLSAKEIAAAKKQADNLLNKLKAITNYDKLTTEFKAMVTKYSTDTGSKDIGGEYTFKKNGKMVSEFENWAFNNARKKADLDIVKSKFGYHIMLFEKITTFKDQESSVKTAILNEKYGVILKAWRDEKQYALTKNSRVLNSISVTIPPDDSSSGS